MTPAAPGPCPGCCLLLLAALGLIAACIDDQPLGEDAHIGTSSAAIHSSHSGSPPWPHVLTCYGGCAPPHYDPSACNHATSCGPIADGTWWYATERAAFYCGAKLKLVRGDKCVVVEVVDNGPADWVEDNAAATCGVGYIIDTSPLVADYFGGGCGWGECFVVDVSQVPDSTPTGPAGCQACTPGQVQQQPCGNCGTKSRSCQSNGQWSSWSSCTGQGVCSPGATQSSDCCDCGQRSRSCTSSCQWSDWSSCAGPDPAGGSQSCDTGEPGPCGDGRMRCVNGCLDCVRTYQPTAELCDGIDNDCSGAIDDGDPSQLGATLPTYGAALADYSFPAATAAGSAAEVWVEFDNVGSAPWPAGSVWLRADHDGDQPSPLQAAAWPAWDVAATLDHDVAPGESALFTFPVSAPAHSEGRLADRFRLADPDGQPMACPSPDIDVELWITGGDQTSDDSPETSSLSGNLTGGCAIAPRSAPLPLPLLLLVGAALWRRSFSRLRRLRGEVHDVEQG